MDRVFVSAGVIVLTGSTGAAHAALVQHQSGTWVIPKGHQITGEDLIATALRELREETGLDPERLTDLEYLDAVAFNEIDPDQHAAKLNHFFVARYEGRDLPPLMADPDHVQAEWRRLPLNVGEMRYTYQAELLIRASLLKSVA